MILPVSFYSRPTLKVLKDLIGKVLVRKSEEGLTSGVIVEAEAYTGEDDPPSYAFRGRTRKRKKELIWTSRIGIGEGKERLWRAYLKGSPFISVK